MQITKKNYKLQKLTLALLRKSSPDPPILQHANMRQIEGPKRKNKLFRGGELKKVKLLPDVLGDDLLGGVGEIERDQVVEERHGETVL